MDRPQTDAEANSSWLFLFSRNSWQRRVSLAFGLFCLLMFVFYWAFILANRSYADESAFIGWDIFVWIATYSVIGTILSYHRPENRISWVLVLLALMLQTVYLRSISEVLLIKGNEPTFALLFGRFLWYWAAGITFPLAAYMLVLFPTGRVLSRRWQPANWIMAALAIFTISIILFLSIDMYRVITSDVALPSLMEAVAAAEYSVAAYPHVRDIPGLNSLAGNIVRFGFLALASIGLGSLFSRYRGGDSVVRQQIKWVLLAVVLWIVPAFFFVVPIPGAESLSESAFAITRVTAIFVPIAMAIAILRFRLFDIDLIIRRTLVYGALTVLLAIIYLGSVTLLQSLVTSVAGRESPVIIVISTLVIAALFAPLRRRIQDFIDRRFYRRKYDAELILSQFAITARDQVDLDALSAELTNVIQETLQPESVTLWLSSGSRGTSQPEE